MIFAPQNPKTPKPRFALIILYEKFICDNYNLDKQFKVKMGGGVAGWLTPGWMTYEKTLSPHIATPGRIVFKGLIIGRLREVNVEGR